MDGPLISVIIPVYNGADYLREAIDSVLKQVCNDYELIVVNDGSNDGGATEAIVESFGDRIRYCYKGNGGVSSALNVGIAHMRGEWFAWLSHDDLMSINRIESDRRLIQLAPNARVLFCRAAEIDAQGRDIGETYYPIQEVRSPRDALRLGGVNFCAMTVHRSCFQKVGLFNEKNLTAQDTEMSLKLASAYPFFLNQEATSYRREHPSRGTHAYSEQRKRDRLLLSESIHDQIGFERFFGDIGFDADARSRAWTWLGRLYEWLGAVHYAEECYRNSLASEVGLFRQLARRADILRITNTSPLLAQLIIGLRCVVRLQRRMHGWRRIVTIQSMF